MSAPSRRLLLRIYAVSLAQLLAIAGTVALVSYLSFKPEARGGFVNEAEYAIANLSERMSDRAALDLELARITALMNAKVSLYDARNRLIASNVSPPNPPLSSEERARLIANGRTRVEARGPLVALPLDREHPERGYGVYHAGRPPSGPTNPALWALAIAMLGAALAAVVLARSFVKPLTALAGAAKRLGEGDLSARVHSQRRDEFGELANAFDDMADRLTTVLRSQQELLANVSHELRTPLARIRVALDIAAEGDAASAQEALQEITSDLAELERLVADVLQTAKLDLARGRATGQFVVRRDPVRVDTLIDELTDRFRAHHPQRELLITHEGELPRLAGDAGLLRRALDNLLDNACAYSEPDTKVELRIECTAALLRVSVCDSGIGISAADLPNIAQPFFRTDPSRARRTGGLGLGLSLARRIVEAHGGTLHIESRVGEGTRVIVQLPVLA